MCGGGGGRAPAPAAPAAAAPVAPSATPPSQRKGGGRSGSRKGVGGTQSTILTGPRGDLSSADTNQKVLLGM